MLLKRSILTLACLALLSCASKKNEDEVDTRTATELYQAATAELKAKDYKEAADLFSKVAYEYPYDDLAPKAHVMEVYSYYVAGDYDSMLPAIDNFLKIFPASPDIAYIYYLRALAHYEQIDSPVRDQTETTEAKAALEELLSRFPDSEYAKDAKFKLDLVNDHLAAQEMDIGRYYLHTGNLISAINRFKIVVEQYQTTTHIQEALYRLVECYNFLGLKEEAVKNAEVLGYNYPESKWYKEAFKLVGK